MCTLRVRYTGRGPSEEVLRKELIRIYIYRGMTLRADWASRRGDQHASPKR